MHPPVFLLRQAQPSFGGTSSTIYKGSKCGKIPLGVGFTTRGNFIVRHSSQQKFIFQRPFRDISTATFNFRAPLKSVGFQPDVLSFVSVAASNPARITTNPPHQLAVASLVTVFVNGFSSGSSSVDNAINNQNGFIVTVIDANTLEFPPTATAGFNFAAIGVVPGTVVIGFRRIAFTVRFRSLTDDKTNGITPV